MGHDKSICLVVSGNLEMQQTLKSMLDAYEFFQHQAGTGREALEFCAQARPGFLVLDCELPDMDCAALIHMLQGMYDQMPAILAFSSEGKLDEISKVMGGGANECLIKPFDADVLDFKLQLIGAVKGLSC